MIRAARATRNPKKIWRRCAAGAAVLLCATGVPSGRTAVDPSAAWQGGGQQPPPSVDAAALFLKNCATCHGKDGRAKTFKGRFIGARNLTDAAWHAGVNDERLVNSVTNGRGKMPSFGKKLSAPEIASLAAYVRGLKK